MQGSDTTQSDIDLLAHHCEATDYDAVWATLPVDLAPVRVAIASLVADTTDT